MEKQNTGSAMFIALVRDTLDKRNPSQMCRAQSTHRLRADVVVVQTLLRQIRSFVLIRFRYLYIIYIYIFLCLYTRVYIYIYLYRDKNLTLAEKLFSPSLYYSTDTLCLSIYPSARVDMRYTSSFLSLFLSHSPSLFILYVFTRVARCASSTFFSFLSFSKSFSRAGQFTITREKIARNRFERIQERRANKTARNLHALRGCKHSLFAVTRRCKTHHRKLYMLH